MKKKLLAIVPLVLAILLAACGPAQQNQVLCPLNYGNSTEDCKYSASSSNDGNHEFVPALQLGQNQVAIYRPSGDRPVKLVQGIGFHEIPNKYSTIWPTDTRTLRTESDTAKCADLLAVHECDTMLTDVLLKGGVKAVLNFQVEYQLKLTDANAATYASAFQSYADFMDKFNRFVRAEFRNAPSIDSALYTNGDIKAALITYYSSRVTTWEYASLIDIKSVSIREFDIPGINTSSTTIQQSQGEQNASAYATQQAIACPYQTEEWKAYCMAIFIWSQKNDGSQPPVPPVAVPTAIPTPGQ